MSFELSHESEKKVKIKKNNFRYISLICPEATSGQICTKFGLGGPLTDVDCFRVSIL